MAAALGPQAPDALRAGEGIVGDPVGGAVVSPPRTFVGGAWVERDYAPVEITVDGTTAFLTMPLEGVTRLSAASVDRSPDGPAYHFTAGRVAVEARVSGGSVQGTYTLSGTAHTLSARQVAVVSRERLASLAGSYRTAEGSWIHVDLRNPAFSGLTFVDESSGRLGVIFPENDSVFVGGPARLVPEPQRVFAEFRSVGGTQQITLRADGGQPVTATRSTPWSLEDVRIPSADATLAGTLYVPPSGGKRSPAIVLVHGSDPSTRFTGALPAFLARLGLVVLTFDKRGNGESGGDYTHATLDTLAADAGAAVRYLAADPRVDAERIGLWGISQGGWVAPLAVKQGAPVSFMMLHAGAVLSPKEQGRDELTGILRVRGLPEEEITRATAYQQLYFAALASPERRAELDSLYESERARGATWLWAPAAMETPSGRWFAGIANYDPEPALRELKVPLLAMFGASDLLVPPERHVGPLLEALHEAGNDRVTVIVFAQANHRMELAVPGVVNDLSLASRHVPGYFTQMEAWLAANVFRSP